MKSLFLALTLSRAISVSAAPTETDLCIYGGMSVEGLGGTDIDNQPFRNSPAVGGLASNFTGWNHRYPIASYAEREAMLRTSRDYIKGLYWFMAQDEAVPAQQREAWAA